MTVMRRGETWSFVVWVRDGDGTRRQVWRGGYRLKRDAISAERRFLVRGGGPTVREFLEDWLVQSAPTRRTTTSSSSFRSECVGWRLSSDQTAARPLRSLTSTSMSQPSR